MIDPTPTHATEKTFQPDRREPDLIGSLVGRLGDKIERLATELEQSKHACADLMRQNQELTILTDGMEAEIDAVHYQKSRLIARLHERAREVSGLREQVNDLEILSGELTQARATIAILREEAKFLRQSVKQEIANRNLAADEYWKCINDLTRQRDQLRATITEQDREIERLKSQHHTTTYVAVDTPKVTLDPMLKPDERHLRYPGASSYPPPKTFRPAIPTFIEWHCVVCNQNFEFSNTAGPTVSCPTCGTKDKIIYIGAK